MSVLAELERQNLAVALLQRHARVSIAHQETQVPRHRLRSLHRELHGRPASCGQLPALGGAAISTRALQLHASLLVALHRVHAGPDTDRPLDVHALIDAYDLYRDMAAESARLDFNDAWVIVRDLRVGTAQLRHCRICEVTYLVASASRLAPTCPVCALYARPGGPAAGKLALPAAWLHLLSEVDTEEGSREPTGSPPWPTANSTGDCPAAQKPRVVRTRTPHREA